MSVPAISRMIDQEYLELEVLDIPVIDPTTCLSHKDENIPSSALSRDTTSQLSEVPPATVSFVPSFMQRSCEYTFFSLFYDLFR